jgi:hypothetical protein
MADFEGRSKKSFGTPNIEDIESNDRIIPERRIGNITDGSGRSLI